MINISAGALKTGFWNQRLGKLRTFLPPCSFREIKCSKLHIQRTQLKRYKSERPGWWEKIGKNWWYFITERRPLRRWHQSVLQYLNSCAIGKENGEHDGRIQKPLCLFPHVFFAVTKLHRRKRGLNAKKEKEFNEHPISHSAGVLHTWVTKPHNSTR